MQYKKPFWQANQLYKATSLRECVKTVEAHAIQKGKTTKDLTTG